jgi:hypothetical protein
MALAPGVPCSARLIAIAASIPLVLSGATVARAQNGSGGAPSDRGATTYEQRFAELQGMEPAPNRVAQVSGLVLRRDVGQFTFESGTFYLTTPLAGRTIGAVFLGTGRFAFSPPNRIEQERLARFEKSKSLDATFSSVVLLFADSTLGELQSKLTFGPGQAPEQVRQKLKSTLENLTDDVSKAPDPDLMATFLNGDTSQLFYADVERSSGGPLIFMLNPHEVEGVTLSHRVRQRNYYWGQSRQSEAISRFAPLRQASAPNGSDSERLSQATIRSYVIETTLAPTGTGDLSFGAKARMEITADASTGPWLAFTLFEKLRVDSARWESGEPAMVFKGKESDLLWVRLPRPLQAGEVKALALSYRGDLIDRVDDFFLIKSSAAWYPRSLEGRTLATFDLTFHSPKGKTLASVGDQLEISTAGQVTTSRWVTSFPIRNASFNLGFFKEHQIKEEGIPPVTVLISEDAHRRVGGLRQKNMKEVVGNDVSKSLRFFQHVYGTVPAKRFFATEIPYGHGEAFPGMVHLSWVTFHQTDQDGMDEVFRAHEVAHQWWGIGVDFRSYHDQWLSEGFSTFSGLWYLQTVQKDNAKYFKLLQRWRDIILEKRDVRAPIWLGYRTSSSKDEGAYDVLVYRKGAWVLHMLRIMMLDLKTMNEDRFTETMRDFYQTYQGKRASTEDFRKVAEKHIGTDLGWFFDQWIYGSDVPTYRVAYRTVPADNGQYRVKLQVAQANVPEDFQMYVPVTLDLGNDRIARLRVKVRGPKSEIDLPPMPAEPKALKFNDLDGVLAEVKMVDWSN